MLAALAFAYPETTQSTWKLIFWVGALLFAALPIWISWHSIVFLKRRIQRRIGELEFRWPISRRVRQSSLIAPAERVFHFGSLLIFERLHEFMFQLKLEFFNGNYEAVVIERVTGVIGCDSPFDAFVLDAPHLDMSKTSTEGKPLNPFEVTMEQRIPIELAPLLAQKLDAGLPFSFTLTGLTLWLRSVSGGESFPATLWHGIKCKKRQAVVCGRITQANVVETVQASDNQPP
jgi:hypothetical protein